jgi:hypothetical protein
MQALHPGAPHWQGKPLYVTFRKAISGNDNLNAIPRAMRNHIVAGVRNLRSVCATV